MTREQLEELFRQQQRRAEEARWNGMQGEPKRGYKHAVRPPWAPPEPPPLEIPSPCLPVLVDLAELVGQVVEVIRCPSCGVFFEDWIFHTDDQFHRDEVTVAGCSCPTPNTYARSVARKYGFLP